MYHIFSLLSSVFLKRFFFFVVSFSCNFILFMIQSIQKYNRIIVLETEKKEKLMKKLFLALTAILLFLTTTAYSASAADLWDGEFSYTINDDVTATITGTTKKRGELKIPLTVNGHRVTAIGDYAFADRGNLTGDLVIPEGVRYIGEYAFSDCRGLSGTLVIPDSVEVIRDGAFQFCTELKGTFFIPEGVKEIGDGAFQYCSQLEGELVIPESVTAIGESAFSNCVGLTGRVAIPAGVETIGDFAFESCPLMTAFDVDKANEQYRSIDGVLFDKNATRLISFPTGKKSDCYRIPSGVTEIANRAFYGCFGLTGKLTLPNGIVTIGDSAFQLCNGLTGDLVIPNSVESIGTYAFFSCDHLTGKLVISNRVSVIENGAFERCGGLTGNLEIPNSVTTIGKCAFSDCYSLTGTLVIPESVTEIGIRAFENCYGFTGLIIPSSISKIADLAFQNCFGLTGALVIPEGIETIGDGAFQLCSDLTSLVIPSSVLEIGSKAFYQCGALTDASFYGDVPFVWERDVFRENASDFTIRYLEDKSGWTTPTWQAPDRTIYNTTPIDQTKLKETAVGEFRFTEDPSEAVLLSGAIPVGTTVSTLSESFVTDALSFSDKDGNTLSADAVLKTGDKIQLLSDDGKTVLDEATIVVTADATGDGESNVLDLLTAASLIKSDSGEIRKKLAVDLDGNNRIDAEDLIALIRLMISQ